MGGIFTEHPFSLVKMIIFIKSHHTKFTMKIKKKQLQTTISLKLNPLVRNPF